jgi:hypothetical protein
LHLSPNRANTMRRAWDSTRIYGVSSEESQTPLLSQAPAKVKRRSGRTSTPVYTPHGCISKCSLPDQRVAICQQTRLSLQGRQSDNLNTCRFESADGICDWVGGNVSWLHGFLPVRHLDPLRVRESGLCEARDRVLFEFRNASL